MLSSMFAISVLCALSLGFTTDKQIDEAIIECDQNTANLKAIRACVIDRGPEGLLDDDYYDSIINLTDVCLPFNANLRMALARYKEKRNKEDLSEINIRDAMLLKYFETLDGLLYKAGITLEDYQKYLPPASVRI